MKCEWCGEEFEATRPNRRFCCDACRAKARMSEVECTCRECGKHFMTSKAEVNRGRGQFCEKKCAVVWGNNQRGYEPKSQAVVYAECAECGAVFVKRGGRKTCPSCVGDKRLSMRRWFMSKGREMAEGQPPGRYVCAECGKEFTTRRWYGNPKRFCTERCARSESNRLCQHKRRMLAREDGGATAIELRAKRAEANGRCHWCGVKTDHLTIDHIIPVSRGGTNEIGNLTFACFDCNCRSKRDLLPNVEWMPEDKNGQVMVCLV